MKVHIYGAGIYIWMFQWFRIDNPLVGIGWIGWGGMGWELW